VPESFAQKVKRRSEIKGLIARYGMPAFWMTINPSDLRNPLVLQLAGITYSADALPAATAAIRQATATSNPVAVAQFFHHTCKGVFNGLLGSDTGRTGILGEIANHFGVVETNGRGIAFTAKNVAEDTAAREELIARTGRMAVPVITVDDEVVAGFDRGRLQRLLGIK